MTTKNYSFVKACFNVDPHYSSIVNLLQCPDTKNYYVARNDYTNLKLVSSFDFMKGYIEYDGSKWKL